MKSLLTEWNLALLAIVFVSWQNYVQCFAIGQAWEFILADREDALGSRCAFYSNYYCFSNYWTNYEHSKRRATVQDFQEFMPLVVQMYRSINWFSLHNIDYPNGGCCDFQNFVYATRAHPYGISPHSFINVVTNFTVAGKNLQFVKARFHPFFCLNVITTLAYGNGGSQLLVEGGSPAAQFMLPPNILEPYHTLIISRRALEVALTFDWFKQNVMCKAQPWICRMNNYSSL
ncbi:uncharacterized protein LOC142358383 [Convolutriloba macropyga]|uniref:uncharacterized protein LOC142358383 n=1 Tax=Convolutriloba macropyga TaxID=536237 RepID=UPI003F51E8FF